MSFQRMEELEARRAELAAELTEIDVRILKLKRELTTTISRHHYNVVKGLHAELALRKQRALREIQPVKNELKELHRAHFKDDRNLEREWLVAAVKLWLDDPSEEPTEEEIQGMHDAVCLVLRMKREARIRRERVGQRIPWAAEHSPEHSNH